MASLALHCAISAAPSILCVSARVSSVSVDPILAVERNGGSAPRDFKARRCLRFMALYRCLLEPRAIIPDAMAKYSSCHSGILIALLTCGWLCLEHRNDVCY